MKKTRDLKPFFYLLFPIFLAIIFLIFFQIFQVKQKPKTPETSFLPPEPTFVIPKAPPSKEGELRVKEGQSPKEVLREVNPEAIEKPLRPPEIPMPNAVFHTRGTIFAVGESFIYLRGDGSNFEDQKPRNLKVNFSSKTIVFEKEYTKKYQGLEGLLHLKKDDRVLIEASENIRGKTEFEARYINKL